MVALARHNGRHMLADGEFTAPEIDFAPDVNRNGYRDAALQLLSAMTPVMEWMRSPANYRVAWWQVQFALGTVHCEQHDTMTACAISLGVQRATISKGATELCRICGLPPSFYMKREVAQDSYRNTRKKQLT